MSRFCCCIIPELFCIRMVLRQPNLLSQNVFRSEMGLQMQSGLNHGLTMCRILSSVRTMGPGTVKSNSHDLIEKWACRHSGSLANMSIGK